MSMTSNLLTIRDLSIALPRDQQYFKALDGLNLTINSNETLALVGESGSGKSLTALAILQLLAPTARIFSKSVITLKDQDLLNLSEVAMRKVRGGKIGIIFQEASLTFNPVLTIGYQISEALRCHLKLNRQQCQERVLELLHEVGIPNPQRCAKSYVHELSGGMRQRAMIAMALVPQPELLIADEPTTALDATLQLQIIDLLKNIQQQTNRGLLFITHDLGLVYRIADQVAVISQGRIIEKAATKEFFAHPKHDYSKKLLQAVPAWEKMLPPVMPQAGDQAKVLTVENLKIYFPIRRGLLQRTVDYVKAVDGVSFSVNSGQTLAIIGESGSGKTTIAKGILHLLPVFSGQMNFLDHSWSSLSSRRVNKLRGQLQMIFQDPYSSMNPRMRVGEIIAEGMLLQGMAKNYRQCLPEIRSLLDKVGLSKTVADRFPHEFSGGQRQRICIARALAMRPKLIICDEPTSALDVIVQMEILQLLRSLQQELGISYLLITHNIAVVAFLAQEVVVLHQGKVVESGTVSKVLFEPQQNYTKQLLASVAEIPHSY